ncbi:DRTGG domain-containing protein [Paenibacillus sp. FSL H8-0034]|uniref:DRTGG domain-containing protein n=1 Tax=Paenibacillus sp. FSL H8-0034 TaxID=2954671 RepID=UPI0030F81A28
MSEDNQEFLTKHQQIVQYIEELSVGTRISVRKVAQTLEVSEGTAYRAIKEAESLGIVSTKDRIGTVRVEKKEYLKIDKLTFAEVVNIVDGEVIGGTKGLHKSLHKFVIGAMQLEAMKRYIDPDNLLIVGNRTQAHVYALGQGAGVLITGGFHPLDEAKELADELELPIIVTSYDTFTVATMINRAIDDRMIKKKIMLVQDILRTDPDTPVYVLHAKDKVSHVQQLIEESGHTRFPVVDEQYRPIGMITTRDVWGSEPDQTVDQFMTKNPLTIESQASVAYVSHTMVWEGIELLPVVGKDRRMIGVISRKDVLKALQFAQTQPQNGETFEDQLWSSVEKMRDKNGHLFYRRTISAQMTNHVGMVSEGLMTTLMSQAAMRIVKEEKRGNLILDSSSNFFLLPIPIDSVIDLVPNIIELSRRYCKIEVEIYCEGSRMAKSMFTARLAD